MTSSAEITSLPTGEPVPSSTPPANVKKAAVPLSASLAAAPANVDAFLSHLHRCLQTPTGIDVRSAKSSRHFPWRFLECW
ncbi:hypothetical protein MCOR33_011226 [Pyricularia grisea]|uniref:Uncharacterized protein n=1 Tax=Pyricularia grisea TaxID=148305 RepID=A0ABQ8N3A1_PYRGI|nr:hypothetical protein MCOR33_011226 [Pyricularia grisea]